MKYLLDTNVLSELAKTDPNPACVQWLESVRPETLATATTVLGELWQGILLLAPNDKRRRILSAFAEDVPKAFRVLPFDQKASRVWGEITAQKGKPLPVQDSLIAAIALSKKLTVVTRDESSFKLAGCRTLNPFEV